MDQDRTGGQDDDLTRVAALAEPVRRALYRCVVDSGGALSREEAAAAAGVPVHTAKFHLDRLVAHGLLEVEYRRLTGRTGPGAGRPSKLYRRSTAQVSLSVPPRRYDLAGQLLARAVEASTRTGRPVLDELHRCAADAGAELAATVPGSAVEQLSARLAEIGYEPRVEDGAVVLANCPFDSLARDHTDLVCGMNLALLEGAVRAAGVPAAARLQPHAGRCCVVLVPVDR